jgi:hypothetical protein
MTTEKATEILAEWLNTGVVNSNHKRTVSGIDGLMAAAVSQGRAWNWGEAEKHIHAAYHMLGAEPTGTGYEWHKGNHAIQLTAKNMEA